MTPTEITTAVSGLVGISLALNGYFLKQTADRLKWAESEIIKHGERLTAQEVWRDTMFGRSPSPGRRLSDLRHQEEA